MVKEAVEGRKPLNRPKDWQQEERRKEKRRKKHSWATSGGCIATIIIPPTHNSELLSMLREVTKALPGQKFKVAGKWRKNYQKKCLKVKPNL
jgi:hypothetical protein